MRNGVLIVRENRKIDYFGVLVTSPVFVYCVRGVYIIHYFTLHYFTLHYFSRNHNSFMSMSILYPTFADDCYDNFKGSYTDAWSGIFVLESKT